MSILGHQAAAVSAEQLAAALAAMKQAHLAEVMKIQRDMARRRRRKSVLLFARLSVFVLLPTFLAALYFYVVATPMYAAKTQFVIQQAESPSARTIIVTAQMRPAISSPYPPARS